jgi:hypothetical protein
VFLARSAGAGIVSPDLGGGSDERRDRGVVVMPVMVVMPVIMIMAASTAVVVVVRVGRRLFVGAHAYSLQLKLPRNLAYFRLSVSVRLCASLVSGVAGTCTLQ